jgi:pyruvate dehydrogenase E2 component (dihydrolipoamide acetyltransferase)
MAREHGLELASLAPERPSRRILKDDVVRALREAPPRVEPPAAPGPAAEGEALGSATLQELNRTQQLIARRMTESASTIPDFAVATEVDMSGCVELRSRLETAVEADVVQPSYNDMIVKAVATALRAFPRANASYRDGRLEMHSRVNVGVAVASDEALVVPTVFDADVASLGTIARRTRELSQRVREGAITPAELAGGTFTVSNLGMYGVSHFTAVINPPQAAILAVGAIEKRAVVRDDELCVRPVMTINLVSDHRILYGADAARFVAKVRALLEDPWAILL